MFRPLQISKLLDGFDCVLDVKEFTVGEIFEDIGTSKIEKSMVKVVQILPERPEELSPRRYESVVPDSTARPQKRPLDVNGYNGRSSFRDDVCLEGVELRRHSYGYDRLNKRQRVEGYARDREVDPDRPLRSRERDQGEMSNSRPWAERNGSPIQLVEDSQRSPINNIRNRKKPKIKYVLFLAKLNLELNSYETPISLSIPSPYGGPRSTRADVIGVPDSPPSISRSAFANRAWPAGTAQDDDTKSESPELGQTLHAIPASTLSSPFKVPEPISNRKAQEIPVRSNSPPASQPNGCDSTEGIQRMTTHTPATLQSLGSSLLRTGPPGKLARPKRPLPEASQTNTHRSLGTAQPAIQDADRPVSPLSPQTPKAKRPKTSAVSSSHVDENSAQGNRPQSGASPSVHAAASGRRRSGIPESEVNWLLAQERSICRPSEGIFDFVIDQFNTELPAQRVAVQVSNGVGARKQDGADKEQVLRQKEQSRKEIDEQETKQMKEQAESERVAMELEQQAKRGREAEEQRLARQKEDESAEAIKANQERVARETVLAEQQRNEEAQRIAKQKGDAAEAFRANEERITREKETAEQERQREEELYAKQKEEAAKVPKARETRIVKEAEDKADQERKAEEQSLAQQEVAEALQESRVNEQRIAEEKERKAEQRKERRKEKTKEHKEQEKQQAEILEKQRLEEARLAEERREKEKETAIARKSARKEAKAWKKAAEHAESEAAEAVRRKAKEDEERAKKAAKVANDAKTRRSKETETRADKNQKLQEAKQRVRESSESSFVRSSTPLSAPGEKFSNGKNTKLSKPVATPNKGTGINIQVPLPSILKQSPRTLRRSVSFADEPVVGPDLRPGSDSTIAPVASKSVSNPPPEKKGKDSQRVGSQTPVLGHESSQSKTTTKPQVSAKKQSGEGKIQSKLIVQRDVKLKGRLIDPPAQPKPPTQEEIVISSESEKSASPYYSDPEDDPQRNGAKAGPSSRNGSSSRAGSAKAKVASRIISVNIPGKGTPKPPTHKPATPKKEPQESTSDTDSIQSLGSDEGSELLSESISRSPARYVSSTPVSQSHSGPANAIMSSPPTLRGKIVDDSAAVDLTSNASNDADSNGSNTKGVDLSSTPTNGHIQGQNTLAASAQPMNETTKLPRPADAKSIERALEDNLQRHISRMSAEPSRHLNSPSPIITPNREDFRSKPKLPSSTIPSAAARLNTSQPRPPTSRFPSLTSMKKNPPKFNFRDGAAAEMPDFMKPPPRPTSSFTSQSSQNNFINLQECDESSDTSEDSTTAGSEDNLPTTNAKEKTAITERGSSQASSSSITDEKAKAKGSATRKYGSVLKRMWPLL